MTADQSGTTPNDVNISKALECLSRLTYIGPKGMEASFLAALMGETVKEIGRYLVYSDYRENETVVFIHDPKGHSDHKYIFAEVKANGTVEHTFIVAAPMEWTEYHREILARVRAATGRSAACPGGGYVSVDRDGSLVVNSSSGDFGRGDHARAKIALETAIRVTGERHGTH
jgi:hypothetical protein